MMSEKPNIIIDGIALSIDYGTSVMSALKRLKRMEGDLSVLPLAAMVGGKVVGLNYKIKRDCTIQILRYGSEAGRRVYERSLKFVLVCALHALYPHSSIEERYSLGKGVYMTFDKDTTNKKPDPLTTDDVNAIEKKCREIAESDIPFVRTRLAVSDAKAIFFRNGLKDKYNLLSRRQTDYFDIYSIEGFDYADYYYGEMLPSTGFLKVFSLQYLDGGIVMLMPKQYNPSVPESYTHPRKLAQVFAETDEWCALMDCRTVSDLNKHVQNGKIREIIRVSEILHERMYAHAADEIIEHGARAVLIAGPSSSGKTTSANRISLELRAFGMHPIPISLDNYYIDRDMIQPDENGELDLENIHTLDIDRFSEDLEKLISGKSVEIPVFNFKTGKREPKGTIVRADEKSPLIIEGIHGLNPLMLTKSVDTGSIYRIYLSALTTLNLDSSNRIRTSDVRLIRRLVRDYATRKSSMEHTLSMWDSVRRGEEKWIFPYQECADMILNTTLLYELSVMKKHVFNLLLAVSPESVYFSQASELIHFLNCFVDTDEETDREIPPTSVMREFIGNSIFF